MLFLERPEQLLQAGGTRLRAMEEELEFDPGSRQLCPDGTCVGLVGADGRCAVCGREGPPSPMRGGAPRAVAGREASSDAPDPISAASESPGGGGGADEQDFDVNRKLCDDGTCVGIIGGDGRCLVCGRPSGS
jgi:hypothetical protein